MANIIIIYSTTDGHTLKICQQLQKVVEQQAHQVELVSIDVFEYDSFYSQLFGDP